MNSRVSLQPAFILHSRHYGDSSVILELLTQDFGRISVLAKGFRKKRGVVLQSYTNQLVSWSGRGEMKTLTAIENRSTSPNLLGQQLYAALYVNEILLRLLPKFDPHPELFAYYEIFIPTLAQSHDLEAKLRLFEYKLLSELGYALNLQQDCAAGEMIDANQCYRFIPESGFFPVIETEISGADLFLGAELQAIAAGEFQDQSVRRSAKRLSRLALAPLLGNRPLKSRELFYQVARPHSV